MNDGAGTLQNEQFATRCYAWSRIIHWLTVFLVMGALFASIFGNIDATGSANAAFYWHSLMGLAVYVLAVARILLWIFYRPVLVKRRGSAESKVEASVHVAFYVLLLALPLSGWVVASRHGMSTNWMPVPMLPQWEYESPAASPPSSPQQGVAVVAPAVRQSIVNASRFHVGLAVGMAFVIALHLFVLVANVHKQPRAFRLRAGRLSGTRPARSRRKARG